MKTTIIRPREVKKKIKLLEDFCIFDKDGSIFSYLSCSTSEAELERRTTKVATDFLDKHEDILESHKNAC